MSLNSINFNFDKLLNNYESELNIKLRDFQSDNLKLWVPEENLLKSFFNLVSSANIERSKNFSIEISKELLNKKKLESKKIIELSKNFSKINFTDNQKNIIFFFSKIDRKKLDKLLIQFSRETIFKNKNKNKNKILKIVKKKNYLNHSDIKKLYYKKTNSYLFIKTKKEIIDNKYYNYCADYKNYGLAIKLDPQENLKIIAVNFYGTKNVQEMFFLDRFCSKILNMPLFEVFEHGIIKLEKELRPRNITKKIKGIISPVARFKTFNLIHQLIKKIWFLHCSKHEVPLKNLFDRYPSDIWVQMQLNKKKIIIEKIIKKFENKLKLKNLFYFDRINSDNIRITIGVKQKIDQAKLANLILNFEKYIRQVIDKRIEVFYKETRDENKLRQKNLTKK